MAPTHTPIAKAAKLKAKVNKRKLVAKWTAVPGATSYQVKLAHIKGKKAAKAEGRPASKATFRSRKLKKGTYIIQVRAVRAGERSPIVTQHFRVR